MFLNMAGRTTLAKASFGSIPTHVMRFIKLLSSTSNKINKIQRDFIWGTTAEKRKMHMLSWDVITRSKPHGGLDIQKTKMKNRACHSCLTWRIFHKPDVLWAKMLIAKHYKPHTIRRKSSSKTWQYIIDGWRICNKDSVWSFNKGNILNFFVDS